MVEEFKILVHKIEPLNKTILKGSIFSFQSIVAMLQSGA